MTEKRKAMGFSRSISFVIGAVTTVSLGASVAHACDMCGGVLGRERAQLGAGMNASVYLLLAVLAALGTSGFVLVRRFDRERTARARSEG